MKTWVKHVSLCVIALSLAAVAGCGGGGAKPAGGGGSGGGKDNGSGSQAPAPSTIQERSMKVGIISPKTSPQGQALDKLAEIVSQKSGGKIKIQVFYGGQLGDDKKMMEATQAGLQEMAVITSPPIYGTVKDFGIFDFPFIFNNEKEVDAILDGPITAKLLEKLKPQGLIGLDLWENGFRNVTNSKHPVKAVEDMKGLKIRTLPNPIHLDIFKALGANPTPMVWSEVFSALESKAIDGQENAIQVIDNEKVYEVQKYVTLTRHLWSPFVFIFSQKVWDKLSADEQKIMSESAKEAGKFARETNRKEEQKSMDKLKANGMQVTELAPEVVKQMQDTTRPVIDKYKKEIGEQQLVDELFTELGKVRSGK